MNYIPEGCDQQGRLTTGAINARCLAEEDAREPMTDTDRGLLLVMFSASAGIVGALVWWVLA